MTDLNALLERVKAATGEDRSLSREIMLSVGGWHRVAPRHARNKHGAYIAPEDWLGADSHGAPILDSLHGTTMHRDVPHVTASIDAALALVERKLPAWCWRIGTCHVSDDAWLAPDWNSPEHGARLRKEIGEPQFGTVFDQGVDIDRRPPGNVPLAIIEALLSALIAQGESSV